MYHGSPAPCSLKGAGLSVRPFVRACLDSPLAYLGLRITQEPPVSVRACTPLDGITRQLGRRVQRKGPSATREHASRRGGHSRHTSSYLAGTGIPARGSIPLFLGGPVAGMLGHPFRARTIVPLAGSCLAIRLIPQSTGRRGRRAGGTAVVRREKGPTSSRCRHATTWAGKPENRQGVVW